MSSLRSSYRESGSLQKQGGEAIALCNREWCFDSISHSSAGIYIFGHYGDTRDLGSMCTMVLDIIMASDYELSSYSIDFAAVVAGCAARALRRSCKSPSALD